MVNKDSVLIEINLNFFQSFNFDVAASFFFFFLILIEVYLLWIRPDDTRWQHHKIIIWIVLEKIFKRKMSILVSIHDELCEKINLFILPLMAIHPSMLHPIALAYLLLSVLTHFSFSNQFLIQFLERIRHFREGLEITILLQFRFPYKFKSKSLWLLLNFTFCSSALFNLKH